MEERHLAPVLAALSGPFVIDPATTSWKRRWLTAPGMRPSSRPWAIVLPAIGAPVGWYVSTIAVSPWLGGFVGAMGLATSIGYAVPWWHKKRVDVATLPLRSRRLLEDGQINAVEAVIAASHTAGALSPTEVAQAASEELWRLASLLSVTPNSHAPQRRSADAESCVRRITELNQSAKDLAFQISRSEASLTALGGGTTAGQLADEARRLAAGTAELNAASFTWNQVPRK